MAQDQLRGASADAQETLAGKLDAALAGGADAARVGADLFGVATVLRSEPGLRRVVTDVSVDASAKSDLVRQIFGAQVDPASADVAAAAAEQRWTSTRDLGDVLEHLGVVAVVRSADAEGQVGDLADELFGFGRLLVENPDLRDALSDPARSADDKRALVRELLEGKTSSATALLVQQALAGSHRTVGLAIESFQRVAAQVHGQRVATVRVARELSDAEQDRLTTALSSQYDRDVHLNVVIDPDVIGGMRVEIGDDVIDGTVSSRLADARRRLAG